MTDRTGTHDWPLRAALLALAGAVIGLALHFLLYVGRWQMTHNEVRLALASFLAVGGLAFAVVVERDRQHLSLSFAGIAALVVASVVYLNGAGSSWDDSEAWRLTCALLTVAIAAPLFQAWRGGTGGIPYVAAHDHAWTNVVLWIASWVFVGIAWGLVYLLAELFDLIGLHLLTQLIGKDWFGKVLTGGALGGAIGLLRDRERILGTLQRVVTTVLAVLAPVLAVGLLAFLAALPFTGLTPLWLATKATTPILIGCVIGALVLCNAVIGDRPEEERRGVLRWSAMGLSLTMLPLGIIAGISVGLRIDQYGLTPDRLWASIFAAITCVYGLAYLKALVLARTHWAEPVRVSNLRLGIGLCVVALILSTPLLGFGAMSTRNQMARLADGRTLEAKFDWTALRFDFGPSGRAALSRLATSGPTPAIRAQAAAALQSQNRWSWRNNQERAVSASTLDARLKILPRTVPLPADLRLRLAQQDACGSNEPCAVIYTPGAGEAFVARVNRWGSGVAVLKLGPKGWLEPDPDGTGTVIGHEAFEDTVREAAIKRGDVEVRTVKRRQIFVGGKPQGTPFD